jgi:hypothetical protein
MLVATFERSINQLHGEEIMREINTSFFVVLLLTYQIGTGLSAQMVISRFDFNGPSLATATTGPNANSIDANTTTDGVGIYINATCGATKGIDVVVPNSSSVFDINSIGMTFIFKRLETRADFFVRGGCRFYVNAGRIFVAYRTTNGSGGFIDYGPFDTSYNLPGDGNYHNYTFTYTQGDGVATVRVDGSQIWTYDGPNGRALYWVSAGDPIMGSVMDGNCSGTGFLDYFQIFNPDLPLGVNFLSFAAHADQKDVNLMWEVANEEHGDIYSIERSENGSLFVNIGQTMGKCMPGSNNYQFTDQVTGEGPYYYRVRRVAANGGEQITSVRQVSLKQQHSVSLTSYPNPSTGIVNITGNAGFGDNGEMDIAVLDIMGNIVYRSFETGPTSQLDLSGLPKGIYQLRAQNGVHVATRSIMLK